jgi:hypothetical protein
MMDLDMTHYAAKSLVCQLHNHPFLPVDRPLS